jgi:cytochrome c-type biogenesis protein CcmE
MHPERKKRLTVVIFIVVLASIATWLMVSALSSNMNLFFTPTQIANGEAPLDARIRAGGMVVKGSVERSKTSLLVGFDITDGPSQVTVNFTGILPDLFGEGEAAVVAGRMDKNGVMQADEVLAKHDENYTPPEVADAMQAGHELKNKQEQIETQETQNGAY